MRGGTGRRELRSVADEVSYSTRRDTYLRLTGSAGYGAQCMEAEMTRQHVHDHSSERKGVQERWTAERVGGGITLGGGPDTVILAAAMCAGQREQCKRAVMVPSAIWCGVCGYNGGARCEKRGRLR